ncbi:hypothetical protein B7486_33280 [cyanobacterium TDX16]|nr:hypothetical protein B7486_33280 [cyanobacterium TDX16]
MPNRPQNDERVTARVSASVKETLQKAADLSGATLNQFLIQAALKEAQKVLEAERIISITQQDADKIFYSLENPPAANQKLLSAIARHQDFFSESHSTTR